MNLFIAETAKIDRVGKNCVDLSDDAGLRFLLFVAAILEGKIEEL